jgi:formylglycine-generating enzyme required for sulfatase activity
MVTRPIKMPEKDGSEHEAIDVHSQRKRPEAGRFLLQVDRQTKGSYQTQEEAHKAGLAIKQDHPVVQVSVYDRVESINTLVQPPTASS